MRLSRYILLSYTSDDCSKCSVCDSTMQLLGLQQVGEPCAYPLLGLDKFGLLRLLVQLVQRICVAFFLQVLLDLAELTTELAVQYLPYKVSRRVA